MVDRRTNKWLALAVLCLSVLVVGLDNSILTIALPSLSRDLRASTSSLQWIYNAYTLVYAGLLVTAGSLGDRFGRRKILTFGLSTFALGSTVSAFVGSPTQLIFSHAFMGIGAALILPATLSLLVHSFPDPRDRGRAVGVWAMVIGLSTATGPVLGGLLLGRFWWGSVFLINGPIALVAMIAGRAVLAESKDPDARPLDPIGAGLSIAALVAVLWAIIETPRRGIGSPMIVVGGVLGIALLITLLWWERRCAHPMLDLSLFRNRRFSVANGTLTLVFFVMFGFHFMLSQYMQSVLGFSALQAGFRMLPFALTLLAMGPCSARLVERLGTRVVVAVGAMALSAGMAVVRGVPVSDGYPRLIGGLLLLGFGLGLVIGPATASVLGSVPEGRAGVGSAINGTLSQIGGVLGVAVLGSILASAYGSGAESELRRVGAPREIIDTARASIGRAVDAASSLSGPLRSDVLAVARSEFVSAFSSTLLVAVAILIGAATLALTLLPSRARSSEHATPLQGLAAITFSEAAAELDDGVGVDVDVD